MWKTALAGGVAIAVAISCSVGHAPEATGHAEASSRGHELYAEHCALCHGATGAGDGRVAEHLFPPPRDFGSGLFRVVSTDNGIPTDADLMRVLRRGVPGSAMASYAWLGDADLRELAATVRELAVTQLTMSLGDADAARQRMTPGRELNTGRAARATPEVLERGRTLYEQHCAACHGDDGTGLAAYEHFDGHGQFAWARDFTAGVLKGGVSHSDLACRVLAGMPGSSMPPTPVEDAEDLAALVAHVRTLLRPGATTALVQHRERIAVHRQSDAVSAEPDHALWDTADEVGLALAPLRWHDDAVLHASVAALHDGEHIAIRLRWRDATRDDVPGAAARGDAAALQLSTDREPPIMGMGSPDRPTHVWHWKPVRPDVASAWLEPHGLAPHTDARPAQVPAARAEIARGPENARRMRSDGTPLESNADWRDGWWRVVFRRKLTTDEREALMLEPGSHVQLAVAIWNGSASEHDSDKSYSIWHTMALDH